jgi:hypothetical protein
LGDGIGLLGIMWSKTTIVGLARCILVWISANVYTSQVWPIQQGESLLLWSNLGYFVICTIKWMLKSSQCGASLIFIYKGKNTIFQGLLFSGWNCWHCLTVQMSIMLLLNLSGSYFQRKWRMMCASPHRKYFTSHRSFVN